ncbi:MAG: DUF433 domain-containing protein [bacterium]|nr:DUF433 domain-containing protein [bacterium]
MADVITAFSEDQVERLTGLTKAQLRYWNRTGFFAPTHVDEGSRYFGRIYSFRDVVGLKTLGILRNREKVSLQHLRDVAKTLSHLKDTLWTRTVLYVLAKRVVIHEEGTGRLQDPVTGQYANGLALRQVMSDVAHEAEALRVRSADSFGKVEQNRFVAKNAAVVAGTRIPTAAIKRFHDAGYDTAAIIREYPDLTEADVAAALAHEEKTAA